MKRYLLILIAAIITSLLSAQTAKKINGLEDPAKISNIDLESIASLGAVTVETSCKNCLEILQKYPGSPDGVYTIDPDGDGPLEEFDAYCDMTTDGGGWIMVGCFLNPSNYEDYFYAATNTTHGSDIGNPASTSSWTDWRPLEGIEWPAEFALILDRATFSTGWDNVTAKVIYRMKNRDIMPNYGTTMDLISSDNLYYKFNCQDSWTDVGNSSFMQDNSYYTYNSAGHYLIVFYEGANRTTYYGMGIPGGDGSWYHSVRMLIR